MLFIQLFYAAISQHIQCNLPHVSSQYHVCATEVGFMSH